ncbi:MAG TPA: hypothetical protein VGF38_09175 [Ktedonobacterales bacterium]
MNTSRKVVSALTLFGALICGSGCGADAHSSPTSLTPIVAPYAPTTTVQGCTDVTSSGEKSLIKQANLLLADMIDAAVVLNRGPLTLYYSLINSHPYDPSSTPMVIAVPSLPAPPAPPALTPAPTPTGDPYADAIKRNKIAQENAAKVRAYQQAAAQTSEALERARAQTKRRTDALRQLRLSVDTVATSVFGCLSLATDRLSQAPGERWLWITGDLQNTSRRDVLPARTLDLRHVHVRVVEFQCSSAPECRATKSYWTGVFRAAGAQDVAYYDAAQSATLGSSPFFTPKAG